MTKFYGTSRESWDHFHAWETACPSEPFVVFVKGREVEIGRSAHQAAAEEIAKSENERTGRETYVVDERRGVYATPVYRIKSAATREP